MDLTDQELRSGIYIAGVSNTETFDSSKTTKSTEVDFHGISLCTEPACCQTINSGDLIKFIQPKDNTFYI